MTRDEIVPTVKILLANITALAVTYMGNLIELAQLILLVLTIGYTVYKWRDMYNKRKKK